MLKLFDSSDLEFAIITLCNNWPVLGLESRKIHHGEPNPLNSHSPAQLDAWLRDGSADYIRSLCSWS